ncbi:hypothetical protein BN2475_190090 [Paraburkholderia ribeironis]|uniref:Uncharacterized protein n=1 Tax=Paraburkholderia ribeironis TaxID=1247936 RepID=A0A1N7RVM4_9BURK|nr:hypothetical protein BN2475_190090 [Paraburkholderia ribeironis]
MFAALVVAFGQLALFVVAVRCRLWVFGGGRFVIGGFAGFVHGGPQRSTRVGASALTLVPCKMVAVEDALIAARRRPDASPRCGVRVHAAPRTRPRCICAVRAGDPRYLGLLRHPATGEVASGEQPALVMLFCTAMTFTNELTNQLTNKPTNQLTNEPTNQFTNDLEIDHLTAPFIQRTVEKNTDPVGVRNVDQLPESEPQL